MSNRKVASGKSFTNYSKTDGAVLSLRHVLVIPIKDRSYHGVLRFGHMRDDYNRKEGGTEKEMSVKIESTQAHSRSVML